MESRGRQRRRRGGSRSSGAPNADVRQGGRNRPDASMDGVQSKERRGGRGSGRSRSNAKSSSGDLNVAKSGQSAPCAPAKPIVDELALAKAAQEEALKAQAEEKARVEAERAEAEAKEAERIEAEAKEKERLAAEAKEREQMAIRAKELSEKRRLLREENMQYTGESPAKQRITEAQLRKLDSSVKKCTGFIRKLRGSGITEDSHKSLLADVRTLNLSRYISEVVTAISECKLRSSDADYAIVVCSELHQRFEEFSSQLSTTLSTVVLCTHPNASKDLPNRRGAMRLLVEAYMLGMHPDVTAVTSVLRELMKAGRESRDIAISNLSVVASFVRFVSRALLLPRPAGDGDEKKAEPSWEDDVAPLPTKQAFTMGLESYYKSDATKLYEESRQELREAELAIVRSRQTKGTVDDACTAKHDSTRAACERIFSACCTLAEALHQPPPEPITKLSDGSENKAETIGAYVFHGRGAGSRARDGVDVENGESDSLFENEEDRAFYNDLPDTSKIPDPSPQDETKEDESVTEGKKDKEAKTTCRDAKISPSGNKESTSSVPTKDSKLASTSKNSKALGVSSPEGTKTKAEGKEPEKEKNSSRKKRSDKNPPLDQLLARLGATETKENADRFTYQFISIAGNSRKPTQRLSKSLIAVSPQKLNVLPAYSRIAASLRPVYPDVAVTVAETLEKEFRLYAERTDLDEKNLMASIKTARYVGEYCKFRMLDYESVFSLLSFCIKEQDFTGHRVDMACHLLESCGRMIYRTPSSSIRMGNLLDTVWRLKSVKNLEARHNTLVETAFHAARPAVGAKLQRRKERPPIQEYIRRLIYTWLKPDTVRWTALQMKRLPWDDEIQKYVIKKFVKVNRMKFSNIPDAAMLIAAVGKYRKEVLVGVVDGLLEAVRSGMERNDGRDAQRRISEVALLGELYNAHVLNERVIFFVFYQFITLGHEAPANGVAGPDSSASALLNLDTSGNGLDAAGSLDLNNDVQARKLAQTGYYIQAPDPPNDFFRVRLICTLLEACGHRLLREKRRKLQVFWSLFERYVFCKAVQAGLEGQLPLHIDHIVEDAFEKMNRNEESSLGHDYNRKPLVEGNSKTRLRARDSERRDKKGGTPTKHNDDEDLGWERATCLEEAMKIADEIEKNPIDASLIALPNRTIDLALNEVPGAKCDADAVGETNKEWLSRNIRAQANGFKSRKSSDTSPEADDLFSIDIDADVLEEVDDEDDDIEENELAPDEVVNLMSEHGSSEFDDVDEEMEDDDDEFDDDDVEVIVEKKRLKTEEEEMFEKELAAFTAASVQAARETPSRMATLNRMAIPMGLMAQKLAEERAAAAEAKKNGIDLSQNLPGGKGKKKGPTEPQVGFKFLVRKGGKSQIQDLAVPASSSLAVAARESESAGAAVQEEKKRLVLESSIVVNGDEEDTLEQFVPLRTQQDAKAKEQSIKEQREADEQFILMFRQKPRR